MTTIATTSEAVSSLHAERFPNEGGEYRRARDDLLRAEIALRKQLEDVAALRRTLPAGGAVPEDYEFDEGGRDLDDTKTLDRVRMSELFTREAASLVVYSFMFGPKMREACPSCTSILDADAGAQRVRVESVRLHAGGTRDGLVSGVALRVTTAG